MNSIEDDISRALRAHAGGIETRPDPDDLARRVRRRRQRRRGALMAGTIAAAFVVAIGVLASNRTQSGPPSGRASAPTTTVVIDDCSRLTHLPFRPGYLPSGTPKPDLSLPGDNANPWMVPGGIIEVWHGRADIPQPDAATKITVLGRPARIGSISDGFSVVFNLGHDDAACSEWALVAHPSTSFEELEQVAMALVPNR